MSKHSSSVEYRKSDGQVIVVERISDPGAVHFDTAYKIAHLLKTAYSQNAGISGVVDAAKLKSHFTPTIKDGNHIDHNVINRRRHTMVEAMSKQGVQYWLVHKVDQPETLTGLAKVNPSLSKRWRPFLHRVPGVAYNCFAGEFIGTDNGSDVAALHAATTNGGFKSGKLFVADVYDVDATQKDYVEQTLRLSAVGPVPPLMISGQKLDTTRYTSGLNSLAVIVERMEQADSWLSAANV